MSDVLLKAVVEEDQFSLAMHLYGLGLVLRLLRLQTRHLVILEQVRLPLSLCQAAPGRACDHG